MLITLRIRQCHIYSILHQRKINQKTQHVAPYRNWKAHVISYLFRFLPQWNIEGLL